MADHEGFPALSITKKTGAEQFRFGGRALSKTLLDFWRWSASDLVSNAIRGIVAEFIVASALGIADDVRREWDAFDLAVRVQERLIRIEVKSAAYLQTWFHQKLSTISFTI